MSLAPIRNYALEAKANPFQIPAVIEGVKSCLDKYLGLQSGELLLIISEYSVDPVLIQAFSAIGKYLGADVTLLMKDPYSPGGRNAENPNEVVRAAYSMADAVVSCSYFPEVHSKRLFFDEIPKYKARMVSLAQMATMECFTNGARFPLELYFQIARRALDILSNAKEITFKDDSGTDLTYEMKRVKSGIADFTRLGGTLADPSRPLSKGEWGIFPPGAILQFPQTGNGQFFFDETYILGRPEKPVKVVVEDGFVTKIEGGRDAEILRRYVVDESGNGEYYLRHTTIGLNPKIRFKGATQIERERHAGTVNVAIDGTNSGEKFPRTVPGGAHHDCEIDTPSVFVDGEKFIEQRDLLLLHDKEIREVASHYGNPNRLLSPDIYSW